VDSQGSIFKTYFETGKLIKPTHYEIEGIGSDKLVGAIDFDVIDRFIAISDIEAFNTTREIANKEGMFCGGSSGAVIAAVRQICSENSNFKKIACIFADSGNRYLSKVYNDNWMKAMGYLK